MGAAYAGTVTAGNDRQGDIKGVNKMHSAKTNTKKGS